MTKPTTTYNNQPTISEGCPFSVCRQCPSSCHRWLVSLGSFFRMCRACVVRHLRHILWRRELLAPGNTVSLVIMSKVQITKSLTPPWRQIPKSPSSKNIPYFFWDVIVHHEKRGVLMPFFPVSVVKDSIFQDHFRTPKMGLSEEGATMRFLNRQREESLGFANWFLSCFAHKTPSDERILGWKCCEMFQFQDCNLID